MADEQAPVSPYGPAPRTEPWLQPSPHVRPAAAARGEADSRPKTLAIVALIGALVGALLAFVPVTVGASWPLLWFAAILAIVALAGASHGGKGRAVAALMIAIVGLVAAALVSVLAAFSGVGSGADYGESAYEETRIGPPVPGAPLEVSANGHGTAAVPHSYGDVATIADANTGETIWRIEVGAPTDMTEALTEGSVSNPLPTNGSYLAVPVTLTYLGEGGFDPSYDIDWLVNATGLGDQQEAIPSDFVVMPGGELQLQELSAVARGETVETSAVFDASPETLSSVTVSVGYGSSTYWSSPHETPKPEPAR